MSQDQKQYKPGDTYDIPVTGSLGLLALGYKGVRMWREVRDKARKEAADKKAQENKPNE
jgi:hypothetical protein